MKKYLFVLFIFSATIINANDTLRIATYNILNYSGSSRNSELALVAQNLDADIIIVQEMINQTGVDSFAISVLDNQFSTIPFNNGYDTDNHIYYKSDNLEFLHDNYISTALRDIAEYKMRIISTSEIIYFYSAHFKASTGSDNEQKRLEECTILRNHLNEHPTGTNFIVLGDFNFYDSDEPGYQKLIDSETDNDGRSFDPINIPGNWHNTESFADIHTQSPRAEQFGGGAHGGLDDRFDFILISESLQDNVEGNTYTEFGNDGNHFNLSINDGLNSVVSSEVADALYYGSDHLPVYCDFVFITTSITENDNNTIPQTAILYQNYPNPFNPSTTIEFTLPESEFVTLKIYNILGEEIFTLASKKLQAGNHTYQFDGRNFASGVYLYRIEAGEFQDVKKMILLR